MNILLTGFEAFLGMKSNPTEVIVRNLDGETINGNKIIGKVLPVDFTKTSSVILEHVEEHQPSVVISLGLAAGRNRITPERIAINCMDGEADNAGNQYDGQKILEDAPDAYFSTLPIKNMVAKLQEQNLPAKISNTAGTYLCNQTMYTVRHHIETNKLNMIAGFVHIPAHHELATVNPKLPSWSVKDLEAAVKVIIGEI
ncbi:pyroglutamyl-peptidase I [Terribacillus saccharophilus]|uniref:pyroglutamyl-peptidase I n=1 Tax=Terribacillus saccharophilus TaxID=361277 RepID=UPI002989FB8F|nr:pyroglutamyl-peptidase I [Terribacillus saccharophilus]